MTFVSSVEATDTPDSVDSISGSAISGDIIKDASTGVHEVVVGLTLLHATSCAWLLF